MKLFIQNRKGEKVAIIVEKSQNQKGLVFIMHGLGGFKEQPHMQTFADAFKENGYTVVRFDTTNTFGESEGNYEDATVTNYYKDLEDVIEWAKNQDFYQEPFVLVGHSLGGISTALYAQKYPNLIKALAPISTVVSGKLSIETKHRDYAKWEKEGILEYQSSGGRLKRIKWSHMEDRLKYDLLKKVDKLTMPVLLIVGEDDTNTPLKQQKMLYEKLPRKKELHMIKGGPHTFINKNHLDEIKGIFNSWIKTLR